MTTFQDMAAVNNLREEISGHWARLGTLDHLSATSATQTTTDTITALELAMTRVYKLAVFIRGGYDDLQAEDRAKSEPLLTALVAALENAKTVAETGVDRIGTIMTEIVDLRDSKMGDVEKRTSDLILTTTSRLEAAKQESSTRLDELHTLEAQYRQLWEARNTLIQKARDARSKRSDWDLGWAIASGGITLWTGSPDVGFDDNVRAVEGQISAANTQLGAAVLQLQNLTSERATLERQITTLNSIPPHLRATEQFIQAAMEDAAREEAETAALRDTVTTLWESAMNVKGRADMSVAMSYTKEHFAQDILHMAAGALTSKRLVDEVQMIRDQIVNEYGGEIPPTVQYQLERIESGLSSVPQIEDTIPDENTIPQALPPVDLPQLPKKLEILGATYYNIDVTTQVRLKAGISNTVDLHSGRFVGDLTFGADPNYGEPKCFVVLYRYEDSPPVVLIVPDGNAHFTISPDIPVDGPPFGACRIIAKSVLPRSSPWYGVVSTMSIWALTYGLEVLTDDNVLNRAFGMDLNQPLGISNGSLGRDSWYGIDKTATLFYSLGDQSVVKILTAEEGSHMWLAK